jgi:hypothetical protein
LIDSQEEKVWILVSGALVGGGTHKENGPYRAVFDRLKNNMTLFWSVDYLPFFWKYDFSLVA